MVHGSHHCSPVCGLGSAGHCKGKEPMLRHRPWEAALGPPSSRIAPRGGRPPPPRCRRCSIRDVRAKHSALAKKILHAFYLHPPYSPYTYTLARCLLFCPDQLTRFFVTVSSRVIGTRRGGPSRCSFTHCLNIQMYFSSVWVYERSSHIPPKLQSEPCLTLMPNALGHFTHHAIIFYDILQRTQAYT